MTGRKYKGVVPTGEYLMTSLESTAVAMLVALLICLCMLQLLCKPRPNECQENTD
jgi:hypothetical protein